MLIFGAWTGIVSSGISTGEPRPWLGLLERVNIYSYLLWQAVLATADYKSVA